MLQYNPPKSAEKLITDNLLVRCLAGSKSYGTNTPTSDTDYRGIFYADPVNLITPFYTIGEAAVADEEDTKYYELSKFLKLYLDCNPNIVELLWVDESDIEYAHPEYWELRKYRRELLSSKAAFTFTGYASAQLKRIKGHNKWISNPKPEEQPRQIDYVTLVHNFTDEKLFKIHLSNYHQGYRLIPYDGNLFGVYKMDGYETYDHIGNLNTLYDSEEHLFTQDGHRRMPMFIIKFNKDHYNQDKDEWSNYWRWKRNRNEKRSELEELYGFDVKHAMHLIRLMRMGLEILRDEVVIVKRPDAQELLSIRNGAWSYEKVVEYANEMDEQIRGYWYQNTKLPKKPNIKLAGRLLFELQSRLWES
jgi:predicted nucleotidyltransferase